jgi:hypothetical protein
MSSGLPCLHMRQAAAQWDALAGRVIPWGRVWGGEGPAAVGGCPACSDMAVRDRVWVRDAGVAETDVFVDGTVVSDNGKQARDPACRSPYPPAALPASAPPRHSIRRPSEQPSAHPRPIPQLHPMPRRR